MNLNDLGKRALELHRKNKGKIAIMSKVKLNKPEELSLAYTPGVAAVCKEIDRKRAKAYEYTSKGNNVAVITDGSAVLGLGNIGPYGALPVMEGKCAIFKKFANIDAFPICLDTQDERKIIKTVKNIAPVFGGINLEDIAAPKCFNIEKKLARALKIPVFHDDQHGTAIVVIAGLMNALKIAKKDIAKARIVINGAGAAGHAIAHLLYLAGARGITVLDSKGIISRKRDYLYPHKKELLKIIAQEPSEGNLHTAMKGADVFIGVSKANVLKMQDVKLMNPQGIVFGLANPVPEILPEKAKKAGAYIIATGRSDYPNQLNNALVFPGFFRGLLDGRISKVTSKMKLEAARALASLVKKPTPECIIPSIFDKRVAPVVAQAIKNTIL